MDSEYPANGGGGGVRRGRGESSLSNTCSSDLNQFSSSNSITLSHSLSNSNSNSHSNQHQQRQNHHGHQQGDPMQSWWESVSKARSRIQALLNILPPDYSSANDSLSTLADSDRPARSLLDSYQAYSTISSSLTGAGDDPLCQWLYDTFLDDSESDLRLVVVSLVPLIAGLYLARVHTFSTTSPTVLGSPSLAGFEAVLLAIYSYETKVRAGKPLLVSIPSPEYLNHHPSLYHTPTPQPLQSHGHNNSYSRSSSSSSPSSVGGSGRIGVGVISPPLEPQMGIKSTKRASIVGVALHCFFKHISQMPSWSKIDLCHFAASWAGDDCPCALSLDVHSTAPNTTNQRDDDDDVVSVREELAVSLTTLSPNNGALDAQQSHPHPHQNGTAGGEIILSEDFSRLNVSVNNTNSTHFPNSQTASEEQGHEQGTVRIPLPWELLQPLLRILGHCLLAPPPLVTQEMKDAASVAVRRLYARASHDLVPQAILSTRSLVQLDNRARATAKAVAFSTASSNANTPKSKKPEVLLVSK